MRHLRCEGDALFADGKDAFVDNKKPDRLLDFAVRSAFPSTSKSTSSSGWTFTITLWVLILFAAVQILAVVWKIVPRLIVQAAVAPRDDASAIETTAAAAEQTQTQTQTQTQAYRPPQPEPTATPDPVQMQRAMKLVAQVEKASRLGDWETAFSAVSEALQYLPDNARLELQRGFVLERLGKLDEAQLVLMNLLKRTDLDRETRAEAARLSDWIEQTISNMQAAGIRRQSPSMSTFSPTYEVDDDSPASPMLEETGLQPGALLGIVDVREIEGENGLKTLRIAIKSRPGEKIKSSDAKVIVRFFEKNTDGEIFLTESSVSSEWISPPVDWADNEPEILDVRYPLPKAKDRVYYGYTLAIYYQNNLQDVRAVPGILDRQFPSELFLENQTP